MTLSLGLAICGFLFLRALGSTAKSGERSKVASLLTALFIGFSVQNGVMGVGALLFANNSQALFVVLMISHLLLAGIAVLGVYTAHYIFAPESSPKLNMLAAGAVGLAVWAGMLLTHPNPLLTPQGGIDWNMDARLAALVFYLLLISIGSTCFIFWKLARATTSRSLRNISFVLAGLGFLGVLNVFIGLVVLHSASDMTLRTIALDTGIGIIGIGFVFFLVVAPYFKKRK